MMNKERVLRVADAVEAESLADFDMRTWACGTSACIAGFAVMLHDGVTCSELKELALTRNVPSRARDALGLTKDQGSALFFGPFNVKPRQAAEVLRRLAKTGEVRW